MRTRGLMVGVAFALAACSVRGAPEPSSSRNFNGRARGNIGPEPCPVSIVGWGYDGDGETDVPTNLTDVVAIAAGGFHNLAIRSDGTVAGWGYDGDGEVDIPPGLSNVVAIAGGFYHSLALKSDGTVVGWGYDGDGEVDIPPGLSNVVAIAGGFDHSLALKSDGTVVGWGYDGDGEIDIPADLSNVVAIAAGGNHSLALKGDATVVGWGYDGYGQIDIPPGLSNVVAIAAGGYHSLALKSDGTVVGWGYDGDGEIDIPADLSNVVAIAAGGNHSLALKGDATVVGWGANYYGDTIPPVGLSNVVVIAGGFYHSLALTTATAAPSGLTAAIIATNEVDLSWMDNSSSEDGFEIERAPDNGGSPGTWTQIGTVGADVTVYGDMSVVAGETYWYRVRATSATCGDSVASPTTVVNLTPPSAPYLYTPTLVATNQIQIDVQWYGYGIASGYRLERAPDVGGSPGAWTQIADLTGTGNTFYIDTCVMPNVTYWYRVRAYNLFGDSDYSNSATIGVLPPNGLYYYADAASTAQTGVDLYWYDDDNNYADVDGYKIERAPDVSGNPGAWAEIASVTNGYSYTSSYHDAGMTGNATYWYRVLPFNAVGDGPYGSQISISVTPPCCAPSISASISPTNVEVDLSWYDSYNVADNMAGYKLERAADVGGSPGTWTEIAVTSNGYSYYSSYADTDVTPNATYWYRVGAYNAVGVSPYSALKIPATIILDDTFSSGIHTNQNLPISSAWWTSTAGTLTSATNNMTLSVAANALQIITYFTPNNGSPPIQLNIGDTLTATFKLIFNDVPPNGGSSQGFRFGLFDFADGNNVPKRVSSDGFSSSSQGTSVAGYALFGKVYGKFSDATPIEVAKRINLSDASLFGTSGDFTSLAKDSLTTNGFGGFANLTPYSLQFVLQRTGLNSMVITITWSNMVTGAKLSDSATDNSAANFSFDGVAYRPSNNTTAPATNEFVEATITVSSIPIAPSIATEPQDQSVFEGQNATFTVIPIATLPLSYQWYYNTDTPVADATNSTLTLSNVEFADAGSYSVVVSNSYGAVTSTAAQLTVAPAAPSITTQPQPQSLTVIPGQYATFTVVATGSQPLYYLWYYNTNTLVTTSTSASLTLTNVQPGEAGTYSVIVSNAAGSVMSTNNAILNVDTNPSAPVFIAQPASLHVYAGDTATFTAAAVGTQPITYQWNKNTVPISGANSSSLTLTNAQPSDAGTYTVVASNSINSTASSNAVLAVTLKSPPLLPHIPTNQFNVTNFGARGDGVTNNAGAIQSTINAAAAAGGGTVEIPSAGTLSTYLSGPIVLSNNVNLMIDGGAMLQMLTQSNWPGTTTFISGTTLHDVEISGLGTIDGQGTNWWFPLASSRPNFISFSGCTNVLIQDVTLQNPPTFHLMLKGNNAGITIQGITVNTPGDSPNTDGMDLASTNVLVRNCFISDGDDNIEIGGSDLAADITVSNCTFGTGHGVSIGSITSGGVHDIVVSNCTFNGTVNGIRMKSDNDRGGLIQNLQYRDIAMTNVAYPITIYSYYNTIGTPNSITPAIALVQPVAPVTSLTPIWQDILISNLTVTATTGLNIVGIIWGRTEMLVSNVTLYDVNITAPSNTFAIYNAQGIQFIDLQLTTSTSTNTFTLYNAQVTVSNSTPNATLVTLGGSAMPPTNNVIAFFNAQAAITDTNMLGPDPFLTLGGSTLAVSSDLNLGSTSTLNFGLGANATEIAVAGSLILNGTLNVSDGGGFSNTTYTLFTYGGTLTYNGLTLGSTPNTNFTYTISTNTPGLVNLVVARVTPPQDPFAAWALQYFGCTNDGTLCTQALPNADPFGKGISNTNQFLLGLNPTNPASVFRILSFVPQSNNVVITWATEGGTTNAVQATAGGPGGGYSTNFTDISGPIPISGSGDTTNNYIDFGGATNVPARYYRVRLVP